MRLYLREGFLLEIGYYLSFLGLALVLPFCANSENIGEIIGLFV